MEKIDYKKDTYDIIVHINKFIDNINDAVCSYNKALKEYENNKSTGFRLGKATRTGIKTGAAASSKGLLAGLVAGFIGTGISFLEESANLEKQKQLVDEYEEMLKSLQKKFKGEVKDFYNYVSNAKNETYNLLHNLEEENNNIQKEIEFYKDNKIDSDNISTLEQYIVDNNEKIKDLDSLNISFSTFLKKNKKDIFEKIKKLEENELIQNYRNVIEQKRRREEELKRQEEERKRRLEEERKRRLEEEIRRFEERVKKEEEERKKRKRKEASDHNFPIVMAVYLLIIGILDFVILKYTKWPLDNKFYISCVVIMFLLDVMSIVFLIVGKCKGELYNIEGEGDFYICIFFSCFINVIMLIISFKLYFHSVIGNILFFIFLLIPIAGIGYGLFYFIMFISKLLGAKHIE